MNWFASLARALRTSVAGSADDPRALAVLSAAECRLYNEGEVDALADGGKPSAALKSEIVRKYWSYVQEVGVRPDTRAVFCEEFGRLLGNAAAVESLIEAAEREGPPPLEPR